MIFYRFQLSLISFYLLFNNVLTNGAQRRKTAVVTLVTGSEGGGGYIAGAIALADSLDKAGSKLKKICLVTSDIKRETLLNLGIHWDIRPVEPFYCNHKNNLDPEKYDVNNQQYKIGVKRWSITCTKFRVWQLTEFERVLYMDSDTIVTGPIDDILYKYSNASLVAG